MTYLAQFPQARYKPAPGRIVDLDANPIINATSSFTIHTLNAVLEPRVTIKGPNETPVHTELRKQTSTIYEVIYKPHTKGEHEVLVSIRDSNSGEISNLNVERVNAIESAQLDYESNARVGKKSNFHITNAAEGIIELVIVDPKGNEMALPLTREGSDYLSDFTPVIPGVHSVNVFQKKRHINGSPFPLNVTAPSKFRVWGRGIASEGVRVGDEVILFVDLDPEASDRVSINLRDP
ncbi:unnamed protein product, partial [Anisakis simplex]|uniref:Filamin/ABP280 repeat protein n=1 Tax=Anisakis simplex TaxID=6269 RepID=A0A0M3JDM2_ANISI